MASQFNARIDIPPPVQGQQPGAALRPDKLDRLRELRATIDYLRAEREGQDPLLAWIIGHGSAESRC